MLLGTPPPYSNRVYVNVELLQSVCNPRVLQLRRSDLYSDSIAAELCAPECFTHLKELADAALASGVQGVPMSQSAGARADPPLEATYGTALYLLAMQSLQRAIDNRSGTLKIADKLFHVWLSLLLIDAFTMSAITKRNHSACCLAYVFIFTKHTPTRPWRVSTRMLEHYFGLLRTCTHERELTCKQALEIMDRFRALHGMCQKRGWQLGAVSSRGNLLRTHFSQRELPKEQPLQEQDTLNIAREAAKVATALLLAGGWTTRSLPEWLHTVQKAKVFADLLVKIDESAAHVTGSMEQPDFDPIAGVEVEPAAARKKRAKRQQAGPARVC